MTFFSVYQSAFPHAQAVSEGALRLSGSFPDRHHIDRRKLPAVSAGAWEVGFQNGDCDFQISFWFSM